MIIKFFETDKINLDDKKFILFYGNNEGLKNEVINKLIETKNSILNYDEKEILEKKDDFLESILNKSLFEEKKIILIKRSTDKIVKLFNDLDEKKIEDTTIIISAGNLEKKSKLRTLFEKNKSYICSAFYPDTIQTLSKLTYNFCKEKNISISTANINLIINKCNGDRENLWNELQKIDSFIKNGKKISAENIGKLTNLVQNHSVSELIDNCLAKNKKKIINILNENNFNGEDCILITRTFLSKSKKILKLSSEYNSNRNIDLTISSAKPPIFWKDKEITKQQINNWKPENIKELIYKLNEIELLVKKNLNNSINIITDFILNQSSSNSNN